MRVGRVIVAERVAGTDRLLMLEVDFGNFKKRAIAGLAHLYPPEHFINRKFIFVVNLKPKRFKGLVSECMILAAWRGEDEVVPLVPEGEIAEGAKVS